MIALTTSDVAKVLYTLAAKIESGQICPRQIVVGDSRFEMEYDEMYRLGGQPRARPLPHLPPHGSDAF